VSDFRIEHLDPALLAPNPANPRRHPERQVTALAESLESHGWLSAPIWNERTNRLVDGHLRVEEAVRQGQATIPVRVIDVPESQELRILATFDRVGELRDLDNERMAELLKGLSESEAGLPTAWDEKELIQFLAAVEQPRALLTDPDEVPTEVETRCKSKDLWALGAHRFVCGDASDPTAVQRLTGGATVDVCFTSPPYDQQRVYGAKVGDWFGLMTGVFGALPTHEASQVLVNLGLIHRDNEWQPYWENWLGWMKGQGWRCFGWYVWDQGPGLPGDWNGRLAPAHEFIFHFNRTVERPRKTKDCKWAGESKHGRGLRNPDGTVSEYSHRGRPVQETKIPDSVFRIMRHKARGIEVEHPAVFPVALAGEVARAFSDPGDAVYDPFLGSGSALIACEEIGRACYGCEIEPAYGDVILARWEAVTGQRAELLERVD